MPTTFLYNMTGEQLRELTLNNAVFGVVPNTAVVHQVAVAQLNNRRQGNASTKTRKEVSGGNGKPYKQKGTGRARQGSTRSPQFRHGGISFGPRPHSYHSKVLKKMRQLAICSVLSDKYLNNRLIVLDTLSFDSPNTKAMIKMLRNLPGEIDQKNSLIMLAARDESVMLSARNYESTKVQHVSSINLLELLKHEYLILTQDSVSWIEGTFADTHVMKEETV